MFIIFFAVNFLNTNDRHGKQKLRNQVQASKRDRDRRDKPRGIEGDRDRDGKFRAIEG
jgi:hypothetical protein